MLLRFLSKNFFKVLTAPVFIYLIIFEINSLNKKSLANTKQVAANQQDLYLYKQMGASYLCKAISEQIDFDFDKALAIPTYTFAEVLFSKHGGVIKEIGKEKLSKERILFIGKLEIVNSALKICPKNIPNNVKKDFKATVDQLKKQEKKNKQK